MTAALIRSALAITTLTIWSSCGSETEAQAVDRCRTITTGAVYKSEFMTASELVDRFDLERSMPDARDQLPEDEPYAVCEIEDGGTRQAIAVGADGGFAELGPWR